VITLSQILATLRSMQQRRPDVDPVISVERGDPTFDWAAVHGCSDGGYPGIPVGQQRDCRILTTRQDGLHIHWFPDRIEMHVDRVDPMRDPIGHALADTKAGEGVVAGSLVGLVLAAMAGDARLVALGAAVGGVAGAFTPARPPLVVPLRRLLEA
jgi:hypothetical protein